MSLRFEDLVETAMKVANGKSFSVETGKLILENDYTDDYIKNLFV